MVGELKFLVKEKLVGEVGINDQCVRALRQGDLRQAITLARVIAKDSKQVKLAQWLRHAELRLEQEQNLKVLETYSEQMIKQV